MKSVWCVHANIGADFCFCILGQTRRGGVWGEGVSPLPSRLGGLGSVKFSKFLELPERLCQDLNKLECGPMPNVMAALPKPNIGGALCSTSQSLADADY